MTVPRQSGRPREWLLLSAVLAMLAAGGLAAWWYPVAANWLWAAATLTTLLPTIVWVIGDLRAGRWGADLLAVLALVSTAAIGEYLAGAIVAVMVATGRLLEAHAHTRAGRDLSALLDRAPQFADVRRAGRLESVTVADIVVGETVLVPPGGVVPVDGILPDGGVFDESALTGESAPAVRSAGDTVRSGVVNAGAAVELSAVSSAADSTYAGIVRLAEDAAARTAPVSRLADRVAVWFLPLSLGIAALAWILSRDPERAVAVLVTATPCPLLLAVPVAITAGMSRASRAGVVLKDGAALELLGSAKILLMDKTGTVTEGRPEIVDIVCAPTVGSRRALSLAAAVERRSAHVLGASVVRAAAAAGVPVPDAADVSEQLGRGVSGVVEGHTVTVGRAPGDRDMPDWATGALRRGRLDLATVMWVEVDGTVVAALLAKDRIRSDASRTLRRLRAAGIRRFELLSGDNAEIAGDVAAILGLDDYRGRMTPAAKVECVQRSRRDGITIMVGDGVNDAPALAAAHVGVALGSRGTTAAAQAADAVILDDRIDRLADTAEIARRSHRIAVQSAVAGIGLSMIAMVLAATGVLHPIAGAVVQEAIDVAVILNALRALGDRGGIRATVETSIVAGRFQQEHQLLVPVRVAVREAADALTQRLDPHSDAAVRKAHHLLDQQLLPHLRAENLELFPALNRATRDQDRAALLDMGHTDIALLCRRIGRHLAESPGGIEPDQVPDLCATLYGLDAVLTLHLEQEEDALDVLSPGDFAARSATDTGSDDRVDGPAKSGR